jgi:hypothetical protein
VPGQLLVEKLAFPWTADVVDEGMTGGGGLGFKGFSRKSRLCMHTHSCHRERERERERERDRQRER